MCMHGLAGFTQHHACLLCNVGQCDLRILHQCNRYLEASPRSKLFSKRNEKVVAPSWYKSSKGCFHLHVEKFAQSCK